MRATADPRAWGGAQAGGRPSSRGGGAQANGPHSHFLLPQARRPPRGGAANKTMGEAEERNLARLDEDLRWILLEQYKVPRAVAAWVAQQGYTSVDMFRHMGDTRAEVLETLTQAVELKNSTPEERRVVIQLLCAQGTCKESAAAKRQRQEAAAAQGVTAPLDTGEAKRLPTPLLLLRGGCRPLALRCMKNKKPKL